MKWVFFATVVLNAVLAVFVYLHNTRPNPDARLIELQMNADQIRIVAQRARPAPREAQVCIEWLSFGVAELRRAQSALEPLALGDRLQQRQVSVVTSWWVYMPPQGSQRLMERKARELNDLGITDIVPITERGQWQHAIALGSFTTEEAARAFLARLRTQGVRTAEVGPREQRLTKTSLVLRNPTPEDSARLVELSADFPGTELRATECPT
jgi:hypothetical protein